MQVKIFTGESPTVVGQMINFWLEKEENEEVFITHVTQSHYKDSFTISIWYEQG